MERVGYDEARNWFWTRTWLWFAAAVLASAGFWYFATEGLIKPMGTRAEIIAGAGVSVVMVGLVAAVVSIQLPWMRLGWRIAFILNGVAGVAISGVIGYLAGAVALGIFLEHTPSVALIRTVETLVQYGTGACVLWGFIFASWFALRQDKYFVERL